MARPCAARRRSRPGRWRLLHVRRQRGATASSTTARRTTRRANGRRPWRPRHPAMPRAHRRRRRRHRGPPTSCRRPHPDRWPHRRCRSRWPVAIRSRSSTAASHLRGEHDPRVEVGRGQDARRGRTEVLPEAVGARRRTANSGFDWTPGLGKLDVRSAQETCDVVIAESEARESASRHPGNRGGPYRVDISCAGDVVKSHYATVRAGQTYVAAIK